MTRTLLILVAALFFVQPSHAEEQSVVVLGAGTVSCGKWIESRNIPSSHYQLNQWVFGFVSGSNWNAAQQQAYPVDQDAVVAFVDQYCKNNPLHSLMLAAAAVVQETGGPKAHHKWKR